MVSLGIEVEGALEMVEQTGVWTETPPDGDRSTIHRCPAMSCRSPEPASGRLGDRFARRVTVEALKIRMRVRR
jgi:hypothetical protein